MDDHVVCAFSTNVDAEVNITRPCDLDLDPAPSDVLINDKGQYVVVDTKAAVLRVFAADGSFIHDAGAKHLKSALGILQTNSGKLVVSDPVSHDLKVFSKSGRFLTCSEYGKHLLEPYGIAHHSTTCRVAVVDRSACCVYIHNSQGKVRDVLKVDKDQGSMEMHCPAYVAFTKNADVLVTDMESHAVYRFSGDEGDLMWVYDGGEEEEHLLFCPCGVTTDPSGNTLVADSGNNRVVSLDSTGHYAGNTLSWESGLLEPRGLRLHEGNLIVAEGSTGVIKVFDYEGLLKDKSHIDTKSDESFT